MSELHTAAPDQTSSIGATWPPAESTHERMRGFYDRGVVRTPDDAADFATQFEAYRAEVAEHPTLTRLSLRLIGRIAVLKALDQHNVPLEAAIPLANTEADLAIAYVGWNAPGRRLDIEHLTTESKLLDDIVDHEAEMVDYATELRRRGFEPHIIDRHTPEAEKQQLVARFLDLYAAFNYNEADVREILANPANTIAYIENDGLIVSTAMAEEAEIVVDGLEPLRIAEITEASTHPDYRRQGLYRLVSGFLAQKLLALHQVSRQPLNALYGESNLAMRGVVQAGHDNGRRFSRLDGRLICTSRPEFGILPQNFQVADGVENRRYNDFALSYYPPSDLE